MKSRSDHEDPFKPLEFAACLVLVGVVVAAVAVSLETAARLFW